jgi:hypothetical protein
MWWMSSGLYGGERNMDGWFWLAVLSVVSSRGLYTAIVEDIVFVYFVLD